MKRVITANIALVTLATFTMAQAANADHWNKGVNARQNNQQARINQGVQSGQLTRHEAHDLERQQDALKQQEARMRASGGGLSPSERERLQREQNALSRNIKNQKNDPQRAGGPGWSSSHYHHGYPGQPGFSGYGSHNSYNGHHGYPGQVGYRQPGFKGNHGSNGQGINAKQESQQERIQQGLQSGQLTKHEYIRLEEKQARFAQLEAQLRASGGRLSSSERSRLEYEQRELSQEIERQKHDSQVR